MLYCCNVSFYAIPWQRERKQVGFPPRPSTRCARAVFQPLAHGLTQEPGEGRINKGRGLVTRTKTEGNLNLDGGEQTSQKGGEETREKREERERVLTLGIRERRTPYRFSASTRPVLTQRNANEKSEETSLPRAAPLAKRSLPNPKRERASENDK